MTWLDKEKLKERLDYLETMHMGSAAAFDHGIVCAVRNLQSSLNNGTFDATIDYERVHKSHLISAMEEANQLREDNAKLVKALAWYADKNSYLVPNITDYTSERVVIDGGKRARAILSELKGREHQ